MLKPHSKPLETFSGRAVSNLPPAHRPFVDAMTHPL
jgi:hypothetical protein